MLQQLPNVTTKIHFYHFCKVKVNRAVFTLLEKGMCDTTIKKGGEDLGNYRLHCLRENCVENPQSHFQTYDLEEGDWKQATSHI